MRKLPAWSMFGVVALILLGALDACGGGAEAPATKGPFTGRVEAKTTTDGGGATTGTCVIAAKRIACQTLLASIGRTVVIFDDAEKKSCTKIASGAPSVETYADSAKTNASLKGRGANAAHGAFTKTGKTDRVAGRACTEWQAQSTTTTFTACVDESTFIDVKGPPGVASPMLFGFDGLPGFALTSEVSPHDGGPVITTTVTKLEPRAVEDSEFAACPTR